MSVNITVNGKFKTCSKPSILDDPVRVKKQLECELRKQRLLEVREESKNLARKIRNDVAAEKERQLRNLEAIKAKELECWRHHVLDQKNNDYRQAIFEIGTAHTAAKLENEALAERKTAQEQERKQFKRKTYERLGMKRPQTTKKILQTAGTQTPNVLIKSTMTKKAPKKHKRKICSKEQTSMCHCSSAESESDSEESSDDIERDKDSYSARSRTTKSVVICPCPKSIKCPCISSSSSSTLSSTLTDEEDNEKQTLPPNKKTVLSKNPAIIVDIGVDSNDSVTITAGEIKDKHTESNRQFSHVVRDSKTEKSKRSSLKDRTATMSSETNSQAASKVPKPRFTQVSQLIKSKSNTSGSQSRSPSRPPPPSLAATSGTSPQKSPRKSSASGNTARGIQATISGVTVTLDSGSKRDMGKSTRESSTGRVQSYDYNNKYARDYPHPTDGLVHEPSVRERSEPSARERAEMERELEQRREHERERMRSRSEERGRKALEREQVKRDCQLLTEKLDALSQQYPDLLNPPDTVLQNHQLYESRAARIEQKRNSAVEQLLLRPAIITCPEIGGQETRVASKKHATTDGDALNLGAPPAIDQIDSTSSSGSCNSILLGYVDDQQQKIRDDLNKCAGGQPRQDAQKEEHLKNLLQRIEKLRKALCEELGKSGSGESVQEVINGVSDVRRERERILTNDADYGNGRRSPMEKHLHGVEQKEALLEQKLRELCKMQQQLPQNITGKRDKREDSNIKQSDGKECRVLATGNKPLEIIIKLKNDSGRQGRSKVKKSTKSPRKLSTLIKTPTKKLGAKRSVSGLRERLQQNQKEGTTAVKLGKIIRQNSYDSNSTSYRSLPSHIGNEMDALVDRLELDQEEEDGEEVEDYTIVAQNGSTVITDDLPPSAGDGKVTARQTTSTQHKARLNPLIAHYIQRLLGMSRNSVRALGVSSSDIDTPSSSVMNISSNRTGTTVDLVDSQERIQRVNRFIEENRTFLSELEDTLRTQSDATLESSIRIFEEVWQQRLLKEKQSRGEKPLKESLAKRRNEAQSEQKQLAPAGSHARRRLAQKRQNDESSKRESRHEASATRQPDTHTSAAVTGNAPTLRPQQRATTEQSTPAATHVVQQKQQRQEDANQKHITSEHASAVLKKTPQTSDISVSTEDRRAENQILRYEQLTENCTQRIAELTDLIQKVRTEKKRLMEVTLSSVSEGRNSTEYIELPDGTRRRSNASNAERNTSVSSSGSSGSSNRNVLTTQPTTSIDYTPQEMLGQQTAATSGERISALDSSVPLEKHKPTGISRDSGISISRPQTAQDIEPPSQASTSTTHPSSQGAVRKSRPPPTMQRYSPKLAEDEVAHELSTIIEVDTPVTSRINATAAGSARVTAASGATEASRSRHLQPLPFPTFEEYAREMNLDVTQMSTDTSLRIHQEFQSLIANLRAVQEGAVPDYREFPTLSAYLRNLSAHQEGVEQSQSPETIEDLIACLRVANLSIKAFPSRQEYMRQMISNSASGELLNSASLENITDSRTNTNTETESESINIEEELRRRQILKHSFRTAKAKEEIFSSTVRERVNAEHAHDNSRIFTTESGIEKLSSTSENGSSEFERQLFSLGMRWPATMRARTKKAEAVGRSNTSSSPERVLHADGGSVELSAQQRGSPRKDVDALRKSRQHSPDKTLRGESPKRMPAVNISAKEVQFEQHTRVRSPAHSPLRATDRQHSRSSPMPAQAAASPQNTSDQQQSKISPTKRMPPNATATQDATRHSRSSRRSPHRSSDCEFVSDFGRPLNLRDFLTKELLKHASSSSSSTPTDDSLRSIFLQSIIDTMTPRTNNCGSNQLDRQKTSTPVTHSNPSHTHSSGGRSTSSDGNTPSQLFSGESGISSVRFFERSITRTYPRNTTPAGQKKVRKAMEEQQNVTAN
ncbi:uncharacterized protein LOC129248499 [Anastrepha obliqua]|uniref:uncharacterized protein LOC129248499 n=1 Tax=Anastrepha obliqua TaxID=95512 RepID=UPI00240A12A2|nr:uncharacterized protein LOC129248499 [Anastrepha obliqua]